MRLTDLVAHLAKWRKKTNTAKCNVKSRMASLAVGAYKTFNQKSHKSALSLMHGVGSREDDTLCVTVL